MRIRCREAMRLALAARSQSDRLVLGPVAPSQGRPFQTGRISWTLQEPQTERREHQDDPDVYCQPLPELVPEEQDVHTDHDSYQREHVKYDGCLPSHRSCLLCATELSKNGAGSPRWLPAWQPRPISVACPPPLNLYMYGPELRVDSLSCFHHIVVGYEANHGEGLIPRPPIHRGWNGAAVCSHFNLLTAQRRELDEY